MAIVSMDRMILYGIKKERKPVLEELQRMGVVDVDTAEFSEYGFEQMDTSRARGIFSKAITSAQSALEILNRYDSESKSLFAALEGRENLPVEEYDYRIKRADQILDSAQAVNQLEKEIGELQAEILRRETQITALEPWTALELPMTFAGTKKTAVWIGTFPEAMDAQRIREAYQQRLAREAEETVKRCALDVQIVSQSPEQTCVCMIGLKSSAEEIERFLRDMGFARPAVNTSMIPKERVERHKSKIQQAKQEIELRREKICSYADQRSDLRFLIDYYTMRTDKYRVLSQVAQHKRVFVLTGFVPHDKLSHLEAVLCSKYHVALDSAPVGEEDEAPVLLRNNAFSAPVETVLETYSMPGRGEVDPCSIMAFFYYLLFGLMLSDAAYGLIMVVGCGLALWKFKNMESGMRKTLTMFLYCGISTAFWGVMFGGYFGDAVSVVSSTFFHRNLVIPPLWFAPIEDPMRMLMFAFALGILHIFAGLAIKFYQCVKNGDILGGVYDVVFWYLLVGGGVVYLMSMDMFVSMAGLPFMLPAAAGKTAAVCAAVGALGIVIFGGRSSKNPAKRIAKGLYELYGVTSYLSDILSYSRLLALGLATGVIAQVFNKMGSMFGDGVLGFILFLIVFLIGHGLNIGINLLGAYVHTNRLQFVEFFGKFYEGGGRKYQPFAVNTKYYKLKEEQ